MYCIYRALWIYFCRKKRNYNVHYMNLILRSEAKLRACDMALDILSEYCYKISLKNRFTSDGAHVDIIDVQDNTTVKDFIFGDISYVVN